MNHQRIFKKYQAWMLVCFGLLWSPSGLSGQPTTLEWVKTQGGESGKAVPSFASSDATNNIYTVGIFSGKVDFDPGAGIYELTTTSTVDEDIFLMKQDNAGNLIWAFSLAGFTEIFSCVLDNSGNIVLSGKLYGQVDFDPGPGTSFIGTPQSADKYFIARYNNSGGLEWANEFVQVLPGTNTIYETTTAIDNSGNIVISGLYKGTFDFDNGPGVFNLSNPGYTKQLFISKYDATGSLIWAMNGLFLDNRPPIKIAIDGSDNLILAGTFRDTVDFDPGAGVYNMISYGINDLFILKLDPTGNFIWAKQMGGVGDDWLNSVNISGSGDIYTTGQIYTQGDFDPGPAVFNLTPVYTGYRDIFISKLDDQGNFLWAKCIGGKYHDYATEIKTNSSGDVLISGSFRDTCDFDPGPGVYQIMSQSNSDDAFTLKLNSSGNFVWANKTGGRWNDSSASMFIDNSDAIITTGNFSGNTDFDPGTGTFNLTGTGSSLYVTKLDNSGSFVWAKQYGKSAGVYPKSISTDYFGNTYSTGDFYGTVDFDSGPGVVNLTSTSLDTLHDIFISKTSASGNLLWVKQISGTYLKYAHEITLDISGNCYITGRYSGTADFDPGPSYYPLVNSSAYESTFILKLDPSGSFVWAKSINVDTTGNGWSSGNGIHADNAGNLYLTGRFYNNHDFDPGPGVYYMSSTDHTGAYVMKLDAGGNFLWASKFNSQPGNFGIAQSVTTDNSGNVYTTGFVFGEFDFDPGPAIYMLGCPTCESMYISKLDPNGNFIWAKSVGGSNSNNAYGYAVRTDQFNNVYAMGTFTGTVDFDPGNGVFNLSPLTSFNQTFIVKLDSTGQFNWANSLPGRNYGIEYNLPLKNFATDIFGNTYTLVEINGNQDVDPGPNTTIVYGVNEYVVIKLDPSGNYEWYSLITNEDLQGALTIAVSFQQNVIVSGSFIGESDFDPNSGNTNIISIGSPDGFLVNFHQCAGFVSAIIPSSTQIICGNDSILLTSNTPLTSGVQYQWYLNGSPITGAISPTLYASLAGQYTLELNDTCATSISLPVEIIVGSPPAFSITTGGPTTICTSDSVSLSAPSGLNYIYQWNNNGILIPGATGSVFYTSLSGTYTATGTDTLTGCIMESTNTIDVFNYPPPNPVISATSTTSICAGDSVQLVTSGGSFNTFQWKRNNIPVNGAINPDYYASIAGLYLCSVTDSNGCSENSNAIKVKIICYPLPDPELKAKNNIDIEYLLYPNPASGSISINYINGTSEINSLKIYSASGKLFKELTTNINSSNEIEILISDLPDGLYFIYMQFNDHTSIRDKFMVIQ